ncbi:ABC transporter [Corynebacterium guangdongense]|uniref:ABC transporter n=1 Tax=Corynebacterium guangdongense TaxID=1783348 RepID=UPI0035B53643|nr:Dynamin family protein [Corynebacterium guangdongense]
MGRVTVAIPDPLDTLRTTVADLSFPTDAVAARERVAVVRQLDDYILPRLANLDAPLLAVTGGSTGSGKSTLVNALIGEAITTPGVIRPTTRQPVLVAHPDDLPWFASTRILPELSRERGPAGDPTSTSSLRLATSENLTPGLALLDAPDFDSVAEANRELSSQLLAAADLWMFVTTPSRYADQVVWNFLGDAAARDLAVVVVLNRVDDDAAATVPEDLRRMMAEQGLADAELFLVPDAGHIDGELPPAMVAGLRDHLQHLARDTAARRQVAGRTLVGALTTLTSRIDALALARARDEELAGQIQAAVDEHYAAAHEAVIDATSDGNLLRTEVLQRWQDVVGTSDVMRSIESWFSRTLDRIGNALRGRPEPAEEVKEEIESGLHAVIVDAADTAAARSWQSLGSLAPTLRGAADPSLARAGAHASEEAAALIRAWQANLVSTIQETAGDKRQRARLMSLGLNVLTVALMLVVFASTAGLTGGELAIAGGSAVIAQRLLETVFGEDNVRRMAARAREDLSVRLDAFLAGEAERYEQITGGLLAGAGSVELRDATTAALEHANRKAGQ